MTAHPLRRCAFGHCLAPLTDRGRSLYCSPEHADAARSRQTVDARAARTVEAAYERISRGETEPSPHLGWLTTTNGVVLDGQVVLELRALIDAHRRGMADLVALLARPGITARDLQAHLDTAVRRVDQALLRALDRTLTEPRATPPGTVTPPRR